MYYSASPVIYLGIPHRILTSKIDLLQCHF